MAWKWVNAKLILRKSGFVSQSAIMFSCFSHQCNRTVAFISRRVWYIDLVGNKAKGRILKRVFQENKACQTNISYTLIPTRTCAYQGLKNVCISENLAAFFSWNTRFEIRPFALLPTISNIRDSQAKIYPSKNNFCDHFYLVS